MRVAADAAYMLRQILFMSRKHVKRVTATEAAAAAAEAADIFES